MFRKLLFRTTTNLLIEFDSSHFIGIFYGCDCRLLLLTVYGATYLRNCWVGFRLIPVYRDSFRLVCLPVTPIFQIEEQHFCIVTEFITREWNKMSYKPGYTMQVLANCPGEPIYRCLPGKYDIKFLPVSKNFSEEKQNIYKTHIIFTPSRFFYLSAWEVCTTSFVGYANAADQGCKHTLTDRPGGPTTNVFQPPLKNGDPCPTFFYLFLLHFCAFTKDAYENWVLLGELRAIIFGVAYLQTPTFFRW